MSRSYTKADVLKVVALTLHWATSQGLAVEPDAAIGAVLKELRAQKLL